MQGETPPEAERIPARHVRPSLLESAQTLAFDPTRLPQQSLAPAGDNPYKPLWEAFQQEWAAFTNNRTYTEADFRTILALLEKYTSFIPSATPWEREDERTVPDVSLYDHLRVTAAIAACLDKQLLPHALEQA